MFCKINLHFQYTVHHLSRHRDHFKIEELDEGTKYVVKVVPVYKNYRGLPGLALKSTSK